MEQTEGGYAPLTSSELVQPPPTKVADDLEFSDLRAALAAGWADFRAYPQFGLFFASVFVISGLVLGYVLFAYGQLTWLIPAVAGFPILAPFTAVGLYEVSRRREAGLPMSWPGILGALRGRGDEQILSMGVIVFVAFGFWVIVAHLVFAVFLAEAGAGSESLAFLVTELGIAMLLVGSAIGAVMAYAFYAITVMSLPMLVDRNVDFLTAIIASLKAMQANRKVLFVWAVVIAATLFVSMIPALLGMFVVLPVLGHATWHLYRRTVSTAD